MSTISPGPFTRTLHLTEAGSSEAREILVRLGAPEPDPAEGGDFRVLMEIEGFDEPYARHFHGVDALQAFLEGCWLVPPMLSALAPAGARLTWLGEDDLGFGARQVG
jgi:hypothetical protein